MHEGGRRRTSLHDLACVGRRSTRKVRSWIDEYCSVQGSTLCDNRLVAAVLLADLGGTDHLGRPASVEDRPTNRSWIDECSSVHGSARCANLLASCAVLIFPVVFKSSVAEKLQVVGTQIGRTLSVPSSAREQQGAGGSLAVAFRWPQ